MRIVGAPIWGAVIWPSGPSGSEPFSSVLAAFYRVGPGHAEKGKKMSDAEIRATDQDSTSVYPVLPLRDIVVFPHMIVPLFVGREKSIKALEEVMTTDKHILLATQMNAADDDPKPDQIYNVGTLATVLQLLTQHRPAGRERRQCLA